MEIKSNDRDEMENVKRGIEMYHIRSSNGCVVEVFLDITLCY
jgi:hypothetical protein